jgi:DNA mismatch endonuclease (patch repair protein)
LRYRVAWPVPGQRRRTIDIAFTRARLAVYIDGCFWHGCPVHATSPKANAAWWADKISANRARDVDVTAQLEDLGWTVMRFWEHEQPSDVVTQVLGQLKARRGSPPAEHHGIARATCSSNSAMKAGE